ncbi:Uncharacterised protein [uncultured archaeon]|nr:Uncharacterised protein [uncultured archaeon]
MNDYLVTFTKVDKSFIIENVRNEADAINDAFTKLAFNYPELYKEQEDYQVICSKLPLGGRCCK